MGILVVDDSPTTRKVIRSYLCDEGYSDILLAETALDAFRILGIASQGGIPAEQSVELILLDIVLPDMDGREACRLIKSIEYLQDIPVIMVTSLREVEHLEKAFANGAVDYITKPINKAELLARIRSSLKLKQEMDRRKAREQELLEVTAQLGQAVTELERLSSLDGLTGVANRRRFDEYIKLEWNRGRRNAKPLSLVLVDIDFFKFYNDRYGHQAGDECLKAVANALQNSLRSGDLVCRYGGEEFVIVLPETPTKGAFLVAEDLRTTVESLKIVHEGSEIGAFVTVSLGAATMLPTRDLTPDKLISEADRALYTAKNEGRNQVVVAKSNLPAVGTLS